MRSGSRCRTNRQRLHAATDHWLRPVADGLVAVLLAPVWAACRTPLEHPTQGTVCAACWTSIVPTSPLGCEPLPPFITLATAIGPYEGRLRDIIQALKYTPRPTIARHLARRMRDAGAEVLAGASVVVPVPLHRSRERQRGFNQARELARHLGLPMADILVRTRKTETQADLPAERRHANVRGSFELAHLRGGAAKVELARRSGGAAKVVSVILVDDVRTTGATLSACAAALLDAGAGEVRALTAARAELKAGRSPL